MKRYLVKFTATGVLHEVEVPDQGNGPQNVTIDILQGRYGNTDIHIQSLEDVQIEES